MASIKGFSFYKSYYDCLEDLNKEDRNEILNAILDYVFKDKKPKFKGIKKTIWTLIEPNLNTSKNRSNVNSGAPIGNKNACKIRANEVSDETIKKQSKNNEKTTNHLYDISLSLSLSNSLSNSISYNNNNIKNNNILNNLFIEYLNLREENNYGVSETVIKRLLNKLDKAKDDEEKKEMIEQAIIKKWKDFYLIEEQERKEKESKEIKKVGDGVFSL